MLAKGILPIFVSNTIHITSRKNVYLSLKINLIFIYILNVQLSVLIKYHKNYLDVNLGLNCKLWVKMGFDPCVKNSNAKNLTVSHKHRSILCND